MAQNKEPVGPNNPVGALEGCIYHNLVLRINGVVMIMLMVVLYALGGDGGWSECWDDEAGAVYYYNDNTGEATWLRPDGVY